MGILILAVIDYEDEKQKGHRAGALRLRKKNGTYKSS